MDRSSQLAPPSSYHVWITIGAVLFMTALLGSALAVPQLRVLHSLQALIYIAVIILTRRNSPWGFGAAISVAVVWNTLQLFITHLMWAGLLVFLTFVRTGQVRRIDTMMVTLGGIAHFILIITCLAAFLKMGSANRNWWKLVGGGVAGLGYLAMIVAIFPPQ